MYDWDSNAGVSWYTMELAEGGSLAELVRQSGPRPLADVAPLRLPTDRPRPTVRSLRGGQHEFFISSTLGARRV